MRKWLLALAILAIIGTTSAFEASMQPVQREATPEDPAIFQVNVTNTGTEEARFSLSQQFTKSGWIYVGNSKMIQPGDTENFNITVRPGENAVQQSYRFTIHVTKQATENITTLRDYMTVRREHTINIKDFSVNKQSFRPGETVQSSLTVQNLASQIISNYTVRSNFDKDSKVREGEPFAPSALKDYTFEHQVPEDLRPGNRTLNMTLQYGDSVQIRTAELTVEEVRNVTRSSSETDRILYRSGELSIGNYGNSQVNLTEKMMFPSYLDPILGFEPVPDKINDTGSVKEYTWSLSMEPGDSVSLDYRVDYWIPLALALAILLGILVLRNLTGSVRLVKNVERGDGDEIKVSIEIINNSNQNRGEIKIRDFVPNVAELDEDFKMTRPDLKKTTEGVEMEWNLEDFKPGEKRVITYRVTPKVEIEGGIELPSAELIEDEKTVSKSTRK